MSKQIHRKQLASKLPTSAHSWEHMLTAVPIRNEAARVERDARREGGLRLHVPTKPADWYRIWPVRWIIRPPEHRILVLDPPGADIWQGCDGNHTVEHLIDRCAKKYNLSFHEARVSVTSYLRLLVERGALAMAL